MKSNTLMINAAIAGILGAVALSAPANASGKEEKGHCVGANSCKAKSACKTADNECAGQNGCKGKGFLETTKAKCDKLAKKDKTIHFEVASKM